MKTLPPNSLSFKHPIKHRPVIFNDAFVVFEIEEAKAHRAVTAFSLQTGTLLFNWDSRNVSSATHIDFLFREGNWAEDIALFG